jgi:bleomycin hydrolase
MVPNWPWTKEARVRFGESAMTQAMLLTGVDVLDGETRRWRVENSWGEQTGDQGFYTMADNWFDEYVFEVVVNKLRLSPELRQALDAEPVVLPPGTPWERCRRDARVHCCAPRPVR